MIWLACTVASAIPGLLTWRWLWTLGMPETYASLPVPGVLPGKLTRDSDHRNWYY